MQQDNRWQAQEPESRRERRAQRTRRHGFRPGGILRIYFIICGVAANLYALYLLAGEAVLRLLGQ